jgi:hypothetical protein
MIVIDIMRNHLSHRIIGMRASLENLASALIILALGVIVRRNCPAAIPSICGVWSSRKGTLHQRPPFRSICKSLQGAL